MKSTGAIVSVVVFSIGFMILMISSAYVVSEGHVGVKTVWGQAVSQEGPEGLKFKMPIMTGIREFNVQERRLGEDLAAATANQLPITANVTMSWRPDASRVLEIYRNFGSPEQFQSNIIAPRLRQAAKAGISTFQASDLIRDRTSAANAILTNLQSALENYPATVASIQIEDVNLPPRYLEAVMAKEEAREQAAREEYNLQRQKLESQREVQTAEAQRDAAKARADGEAYRIVQEAQANSEAIRLEGEAQADAIRAQAEALGSNPIIVEYQQATRWNGQMPTMMVGNETGLLMSMPDTVMAQR